MILNGLKGEKLPVYGKGHNVRDWLHVEDHAKALGLILLNGEIGRSYNVGGDAEMTNLDVVKAICDRLDFVTPKKASHHELISYVTDRLGHDRRYAVDTKRIKKELGWKPHYNFATGLNETVDWYLNNEDWWKSCN